LILDFPEYDYYWHIASIRLGKRIYRNTNKLIDAYAGTDGMKTGFICASGFNLVATATRGGKRLIAVVLGATSSTSRAVKAAHLFERGFSTDPFAWLTPSPGTVDSLVPIDASPPDLHEDICGNHRRHRPTEDGDDGGEGGAVPAGTNDSGGQHAFAPSSLPGGTHKGAAVLTSGLAASIAPVEVYTGPARNGVTPAAAAPAAVPKKKPQPTAVAAKPPAAKPAPAIAAPHPPQAAAAGGTKSSPGSDKAAAGAGSKPKPATPSPKQPLQLAPKAETQ
jgi:D-alanyl-D-alanine carboxypeptidase